MAQRSDIRKPLIVAALIVVVTVIVAVGGVVLKTRDQINRDKAEFVADSNAKQVAPLRRVIQLRLAQDKTRLVQFAANRSVLGPGRSRIFGEFALVALVMPASRGQWGVSWIEKGPLYPRLQSNAVLVTPGQEVALVKSLPFDRVKNGEVYWQRLSDSRGRPLWSLTVAVETQSSNTPGNPTVAPLPEGTDYQSAPIGTGSRAYVVGLFGSNPLITATEDYIGSTSSAFVIDTRGYAATHSDKEMIGTLMKDDPLGGPIAKEILQSRSSAGALRYKTAAGNQVFSAFEQVDRSNLFVVMSTPDTVISTSAEMFSKTAFTTGGLAILVGLLLVFAWGAKLLPQFSGASGGSTSAAGLSGARFLRPGSLGSVEGERASIEASSSLLLSTLGQHRRTEQITPEMRRPLELPEELKLSPNSVQVRTAPIATGRTAGEVDQGRILKSLVSGMEGTLKEPVLAALAHIQLASGKLREITAVAGGEKSGLTAEIAEHIAMIEQDLRRAKDTVDEFGRLGLDAIVPKDGDRADIAAVLRRVLDRGHTEMQDLGITVIEKIQPSPMIKGFESSLESIFEEILVNAKRGLQGRSDKTLRIEIKDSGEVLTLSFSDNGVGMDRESRRQAFDPFFHLFDDPSAKGLGLTRVRSVAMSHGGSCELSSSPGDGTTVVLRFPIQKHERELFEALRKKDSPAATVAVKASASTPSPASAPEDDDTHSGNTGSSLNFSSEGAVSLGGKVPLPAKQAAKLPPPPRPGTEEGPEFRSQVVVADESAKNQVDQPESDTVVVRVRPVQRG